MMKVKLEIMSFCIKSAILLGGGGQNKKSMLHNQLVPQF